MNIYCLTVAGSDRHKLIQEQLDKLKAVNYEYIYGPTAMDLPIKNLFKTPYGAILKNENNTVNTKELQNIEHCYCTKAGMVAAMEKIAEDLYDDEWAFFVQDDVNILPDYYQRYEQIIQSCPKVCDGISVTYNPFGGPVNKYRSISTPFCTETALLLKPSFARRYVQANKNCVLESDMSMLLYSGEQHLVSAIPMATLKCTKSMIYSTYD